MTMPNFKRRLITAVVQDVDTGEVLMVAHMNKEAWRLTMETKMATYFSRKEKRLWVKGEESGHAQEVVEIRVDCDGDAVLLKVRQTGGACHDGYRSCFYRRFAKNGEWLIDTAQIFDPEVVYGKNKTG